MQSLLRLMFIPGYLLLISPPRAIDLRTKERAQDGELSRQPLIVVLGIEFLLRGAVLLVLAVGAEQLVGDRFYETYHFDYLGILLIVIGAFHTLIYYLFLGLFQPQLGQVGFRVYRLLRNLAYAFLPGIVALLPVLLWQNLKGVEPFSGTLPSQVYLSVTALMILAGIIEAAITKRRPLGLDENLKIDFR